MKTIPEVIPAGWRIVPIPETPGYQMLARRLANGLMATFSIETYADTADPAEAPPCGGGRYRRVVLSRKNMYPTWDEMRDFIYSCGLFDHTRDVIMLLPPPELYLNLHPNAFHFFQKEKESNPCQAMGE